MIALTVFAAAVLHIFLPAYRNAFVVFAIGVLLCVRAASMMMDSFHSTVKVSAVLTDYGFERFKSHVTSSPVFSYRYQGKAYTETSREVLSPRYAIKHYKKGEIYDIWVSAKNPTCIKLTRRIRLLESVMLAIGLGLVAASVWSLFL